MSNVEQSTNIEKMILFISAFPSIANTDISVDYSVNQDPNITFTPNGASVSNISLDVYGNADIAYEYNCVLLLTRKILQGELGLDNQIFIEDLQNWIIEQNFSGVKPTFGDKGESEIIIANNASLLYIDEQATRAVYSLGLRVNYTKHYDKTN